MKRTIIFTASLLLFAFFASAAIGRPGGGGKGPFEAMDTDKDEKISEAEWTAFQAKMFKEMDKNGDGYLSDDELRPPRSKHEGMND
ncbi:MAG: hypothetical protein V1874_00335 [Spirochaetota bacterium]